MTDQKPTGVFVRLPLSDEQIVSIAGWIPGSREELRNEVLPSIFSIIGTPVTGGGGRLEVVGYISHIVADALRDPTSGINVTQLRAERNGCVSAPLVLKTDADAEIAKRDAEIVRLNSELSGYRTGLSELVAKEVAENLKGPEA